MEDPRPKDRPFFSGYSFVFTGVVALSNIALMAVAWQDRSWTAFGIAMLFAPATNLGLTLASLFVYTALPNRHGRSFSRHAIVSVSVPAVALVCDFLQFSVMSMHGC